MENKIILPPSFFQSENTPSPDFVRRMESIDRFLVVYWNRFRGRWIIDRYTCETYHSHGPHCPRVNVKLIEGDNGEFHPLNDRVLDWLNKADMWKHGNTPDRVNAELDAKKAAFERSQDDNVRLYVKDTLHDEHIHQESNLTPN